MNKNKFDLFVFYSNLDLICQSIEASVQGVVIDLEHKGKGNRQNPYNTQISTHTVQDLKDLRNEISSYIICRINGGRYLDQDEIIKVIDSGADEILIPMVTSLDEIDYVSKIVNNQICVSVMIETNEGINIAKEINSYSISRVFVGLNDLAISRNSRNIFMPLVDGTLDSLRPNFTVPFGVAGLTHPYSGYPIPCKMLINEMKRLNCSFGFLRRSFYKDLGKYSQKEIFSALRNEFSNGENEELDFQDFKKRTLSLECCLI